MRASEETVMRTKFHRIGRLPSLILTVVLVAGATAAAVTAAIPSGNGVIHACYKKSGVLRVIDAEAGKSCAAKETPLSWSTGERPETVPPALVSLNNDGTLNAAASRGVTSIKVVYFETTNQPPQAYAVCFDLTVAPVWGTTSGGGYLAVSTSSISSDVEEISDRCGPGYNAVGPAFGHGVGSQPISTIRYIFWQ
jgi:hypothetical protein